MYRKTQIAQNSANEVFLVSLYEVETFILEQVIIRNRRQLYFVLVK